MTATPTANATEATDPTKLSPDGEVRPIRRGHAEQGKPASDGSADETGLALHALSERVHGLSEYTKALADEVRLEARDKMRDVTHRTGARVAAKPFQSIALAAIAGAVVTLLLRRR